MNRIVHPSALDDLEEASVFYEKQQVGLGAEVFADLSKEIAHACEGAGSHRRLGKFHRYVASGRFPYFCIYYTLESDGVHVRAVLDHRRNPRTLRRRLREV
jgi:plasmid stabilization system protein ParE